MNLVKIFKKPMPEITYRNPMFFAEVETAGIDGQLLCRFPYRDGMVCFTLYPATRRDKLCHME